MNLEKKISALGKIGPAIIASALAFSYSPNASADDFEDIYEGVDAAEKDKKDTAGGSKQDAAGENKKDTLRGYEKIFIGSTYFIPEIYLAGAQQEEHKNPEYTLSPDGEKTEEEFRKTSLLDATILTGVPALGASIAWIMNDPQYKGRTADEFLEDFKEGFTGPPRLDNNPWYINYVGHPLFGSEAYLLARNRGVSPFGSFLYSTAASVAWEYLIENWVAHPSIQDLLVTSPIGSLIGEGRYYGKKELMKKKDKNALDNIAIVILDPIDALYRFAESL